MRKEFLSELVKLADHFDKQGMIAEASEVDALIKKAVVFVQEDPEQKAKESMSQEEKTKFEDSLTEIENFTLFFAKQYQLDVPPRTTEWSLKVYNWIKTNKPQELDNPHKQVVGEALAVIYPQTS